MPHPRVIDEAEAAAAACGQLRPPSSSPAGTPTAVVVIDLGARGAVLSLLQPSEGGASESLSHEPALPTVAGLERRYRLQLARRVRFSVDVAIAEGLERHVGTSGRRSRLLLAAEQLKVQLSGNRSLQEAVLPPSRYAVHDIFLCLRCQTVMASQPASRGRSCIRSPPHSRGAYAKATCETGPTPAIWCSQFAETFCAKQESSLMTFGGM
jgi:hypothetical protein